jgi:dTDP-D-glucose 4,6-dehydratase
MAFLPIVDTINKNTAICPVAILSNKKRCVPRQCLSYQRQQQHSLAIKEHPNTIFYTSKTTLQQHINNYTTHQHTHTLLPWVVSNQTPFVTQTSKAFIHTNIKLLCDMLHQVKQYTQQRDTHRHDT